MQRTKSEQSNQIDMFGGVQEDVLPTIRAEDVEPWTFRRLIYDEIDVLGTCVSGHPVDDFVDEIKSVLRVPLHDLGGFIGQNVEMICRVVDAAERTGRDRTISLVGQVDDGTDQLSFALYHDDLSDYKHLLRLVQ